MFFGSVHTTRLLTHAHTVAKLIVDCGVMSKQTLMIEERGLGLAGYLPHGFSVTTASAPDPSRGTSASRHESEKGYSSADVPEGRPLETPDERAGDLLDNFRQTDWVHLRTSYWMRRETHKSVMADRQPFPTD